MGGFGPDDVEGHRKIFERADAIIDARNQRYGDWSAYPAMIRATLSALGQSVVPYTYVDNVYCYGRPHGDSVMEDAPSAARGAAALRWSACCCRR